MNMTDVFSASSPQPPSFRDVVPNSSGDRYVGRHPGIINGHLSVSLRICEVEDWKKRGSQEHP